MKLLKKVSNVLNITFNGDYSSRAGVTFRKNRRNTQLSVMVGSAIYNNVYGIITDKISDADMKGIANNMANIANIGKLISEEMKKAKVKPHGRWFVTPSTVRTQVKYNYKIYNAVYSTVTGKQIGKLGIVPSSEVKPASIPALRNKKVEKKQEAAKAASPQFDRDRFNKYVQLVADFRKYYKVNAEKLLKLKLKKEVEEKLNLDNPNQVLYEIIKQVRIWNGKEYKAPIEIEVDSIINKVTKIKEERKESADAGSSLSEESKTELSMKGFELI